MGVSSETAGTAIVTGGTGGLGTAVTGRLLTGGWRVVVPWVAEAELERLPDGIRGHDGLELVQADLFEADQVAATVERAASHPNRPLQAIANLVGGFAMGARVHETPLEDFEAQLRLNLRPTYLVTQAALPHMLERHHGAIVNVSSRAALQPFKGAAGYITAKAAVTAFTAALHAEYKGDGIRANAIVPSVIDTPANRASMPNADHASWPKPEEIAETVAYLLSDAARLVSGAAVPVYGRA